jgi:hypothetical protein
MTSAGVSRAAERVSLACKALSAAANDLAVAQHRDGLPVDDTADALEAQIERVCALAEELGELAWNLTLARTG